MTKSKQQSQSRDPDDAIRLRVIERVVAINTELLGRLATVAEDLATGGHRAALGGLDGLEHQIGTMRSLLLLLP